MTNQQIAELLRKVAAAYQIRGGDRFRIIAYERAADSIEHMTSEVKDLWDDGKLDEIPGVGKSLTEHLDELFKSGRVKHFDDVLAKVPESVFPLLNVPGLGPKKAFRLVTVLKLEESKNIIDDLEKAAMDHRIAVIETFGEKSETDIAENIRAYKLGQFKENRMSLVFADKIAEELIIYMKKLSEVERIDVLGSLRRQVATIGDIDLAVATSRPDQVIDHFIHYPKQKLIEKGPEGASILLHNGRQVDLRIQNPDAYGAMLQYFTGSKNHNIKLRSYALEKGLSLNEYGIKHTKTGKLSTFKTEEDFYGYLKMSWIPPEIREDKGEIEAAIRDLTGKAGGLPKLVTLKDITGDLHIHTNYDLSSSHDLGQDNLSACLNKAADLGYEYVGISDHNPSVNNHTKKEIVAIMKRRKEVYDKIYNEWLRGKYPNGSHKGNTVRLFIMCEVDIMADGQLALPDDAFEYVDAVIASVHSSFNQDRKVMTKRVLTGLSQNSKVKIYGHPTGRLLGKREGYELNWSEIFSLCQKRSIALEINAYPDRLDLPDTLVFEAKEKGVRCCIDTDAHAVTHMNLMKYGISVARRGWLTKRDIVNTLNYNDFDKWIRD